MTLADFLNRAQSTVNAIGARDVTPADEDLAYVALQLEVSDTTGTLRVTGVDGTVVNITEAHLTAMGGKVRFAVKRVHSTGTTVTGIVALV